MKTLTVPGMSSPFGMPVLEVGPLTVARLAEGLEANTVKFVASQQVRMGFLEDEMFLVIHAIRGAIHRRVQQRGETYPTKDAFDRADELLANLRAVLRESGHTPAPADPRSTRDALIELAATATEWAVAIDRARTEKE